MSLGGQITEDDIRRYMAMQTATPPAGPSMSPYMDPTAMAQQAILARPMRPSFTGQQLMSREVPVGAQGNSGLAYPSMASTGLLNVPSYTSRYAGTDSGGGSSYSNQPSGTWSGYDPNSYTGGLFGALMGQQAPAPVSDMGTSAVAAAADLAAAMAAYDAAMGAHPGTESTSDNSGGGFSNDAGGQEASGSLGF